VECVGIGDAEQIGGVKEKDVVYIGEEGGRGRNGNRASEREEGGGERREM